MSSHKRVAVEQFAVQLERAGLKEKVMEGKQSVSPVWGNQTANLRNSHHNPFSTDMFPCIAHTALIWRPN
jgi:hypothetical protein